MGAQEGCAGEGMSRQKLIPTNTEEESSFSGFCVGDNAELIAELQRIVHQLHLFRVLYLYGEAGSGKTHLLNACCQLSRTLRQPHIYLPVGEASEVVLPEHIAPQSLLCIDNLQACREYSAWQVKLLGLYEKLSTNAGAVIVAADCPTDELGLQFKDLQSRLVSGGVYKVAKLNDTDKRAALKARARQKGFDLNDQLLQFMMTYYRRDTVSLFALLDRIDHVSMAEKRNITVPFIKSLM